MTQNAQFNLDILEKAWGFEGILMSDWWATYNGVVAANAGLDLEMPFAQYMTAKTLLPAIRSGKASEAIIDDKGRRLLRIADESGFLTQHRQLDPSIPLYGAESLETGLQSAEGAWCS